MKNLNYLYWLFILAYVFSSCQAKHSIDMLLVNGNIYTVSADFKKVEAVAVHQGKILDIGSTKNLLEKYSSRQIIDLEGNAAYPGFHDGHCHFVGYAESLVRYADLTGTTSFKEVLERLKLHASKYPQGWLLGRGWDQNDWKDRSFPTREMLDKQFPDRPVLLIRIDGHAVMANAKALDHAGFNANTRIYGGELIKKNGVLSGVLIDAAADSLKKLIPAITDEALKKGLLLAQENCFANGLTAVSDAGLSKHEIEIIQEMQHEGILQMKVDVMISPSPENLNYYLKSPAVRTDKLNIGAIKLYADGALGSRGALLKEPYMDDPDNNGLLLHPISYFDSLAQLAFTAGFQLNTHAIGDSANKIMLDIYTKYLKTSNDRRWRLEHAQIVDPADRELFGACSIIPSIQTTHATSDMYWAETRLGKERLPAAYAYQSLLQQNNWLVNGTDFPIEGVSPLRSFYAATVRKDVEGFPEAGFQADEALTPEQALRSITIWPARGCFRDSDWGSLEIGKTADLVVLDEDIMRADEKELINVRVLLTISSGKIVFSE